MTSVTEVRGHLHPYKEAQSNHGLLRWEVMEKKSLEKDLLDSKGTQDVPRFSVSLC